MNDKLNLTLKSLLLPIDGLAVILAFVYAYMVRSDGTIIYMWPMADFIRFIVYLIPLWLIVYAFLGIYSFNLRLKFWDELLRLIVGGILGWSLFVIAIFFMKTTQTLAMPRTVLIYAAIAIPLFTIIGHGIIGLMRKIAYSQGIGLQKVLLVSEKDDIVPKIKSELAKEVSYGYHFVGQVATNERSKIISAINSYKPDELWLLDGRLLQKEDAELIENCEQNGVLLKIVPDVFDIRAFNVRSSAFAGITFVEFVKSPLGGWGRIAKRLFDLVISITAIIILSPIMLIVAIAIKLTSPGPVFFVQERVTTKNRHFRFYKFRSMKVGAEKEHAEMIKKHGNMFKLKNDPRVTSIGKFLRSSSLDELPQLFCVFKGNMSIVGPRPPMPIEVEQYSNWHRRRLAIKPGITGLWQVSGRSELTFDDWVKLDVYYIEHWSFTLDLYIFFKTIWVIFRRKGAY